MKNNVKKIIATVVFLAIGICLFNSVSYVLRPTSDEFYRSEIAGFYAEEEDSLDVVFLGSSAAYRFFNGMTLWDEYGMTSYNLATPGQSCFVTEALVDEVLKTQSPDVLVIETRKFIRTQEKNDKAFRWPLIINNMNYSWNRMKIITELYDNWEDRINNYFDILQYHDNWEQMEFNDLAYWDNEKPSELHGFDLIKRVEPQQMKKIYKDIEPVAVPKVAEDALISLLDKCDEEGIQVLFTATPWKIEKENQQQNLYIKEIIEERGYKFLDMNQCYEEIGLDFDVDYYDKNHTNLVGSEKVSNFFGKYLLENYDMDLEHSEEIIKTWDASHETYNAAARLVRAEIKEKAKH